MLCDWVFSDVSMDQGAFIYGVKESKKCNLVLRQSVVFSELKIQ